MKKIAFFGLSGSFGHHGIGGTESITRRLAYGLVELGFTVSFVRFGKHQEGISAGKNGVSVYDYLDFESALHFLQKKYDQVLTIYIPPRNRLAFGLFRKKNKEIRFHFLFQVFSASLLKRAATVAELRLFPYNGYVFCVSPRLQKLVLHFSNKAVLLLPPVPELYFLKPDEKLMTKQLRITYMGRLDPGKGADIAIRFFKQLVRQEPEIDARIYGYTWPGYSDTEQLESELLNQQEIAYYPTERHSYSPEMDTWIHEVLCNTDVLFLPYVKLSSTVDTPLVLLEGMAHLCAVITRPLGDLPQIYGRTSLMFEQLEQLDLAEQSVLELRHSLFEERQRIFHQVNELGYQTSQVVAQLAEYLQS